MVEETQENDIKALLETFFGDKFHVVSPGERNEGASEQNDPQNSYRIVFKEYLHTSDNTQVLQSGLHAVFRGYGLDQHVKATFAGGDGQGVVLTPGIFNDPKFRSILGDGEAREFVHEWMGEGLRKMRNGGSCFEPQPPEFHPRGEATQSDAAQEKPQYLRDLTEKGSGPRPDRGGGRGF